MARRGSCAHVHHALPVVYRSYAPQLLPVTVEENLSSSGGAETTSACVRPRRSRRAETMKETFARVIGDLLNTGSQS